MTTKPRKPLYIYPYHRHSQSAKRLADNLPARRIRGSDSVFEGHPDKIVINWGSRSLSTEARKCRVINTLAAMEPIPNKRMFFQLMDAAKESPRIPDWTRDPLVALDWVEQGHEVIARQKEVDSGGNGIIFGSSDEDREHFLECPLFIRYIKKKEEYRVHIMGGVIIDIQQKMLRTIDAVGNKVNPDLVDFRVRNLKNGFIFARNGVTPPQDVVAQAMLSFNATELHFGAVDVIYNQLQDKAYVLEINTAPGLMGTTGDNYVRAFREYIASKS